MRPSVIKAQGVAATLRRSGYPEAIVAQAYCIDGHVGQDGFYTETVSVYAGPHKPETVPPFIRSAIEKTKARMGIT